ncbi:MAG: hypothetical protein ABI645_04285 [Pseudomonadota bacterium]
MDDTSFETTTVAVDPRHVGYTQIMYALHAASIAIGVLSSAFIVTAFVFGVPSIIAVIMNYARREKVRGTWLESHFRWQLRSFWFALVAFLAASLAFWPLTLILIGWPLLLLSYFVIGAWAIYRIARGWNAVNNHRPMPLS